MFLCSCDRAFFYPWQAEQMFSAIQDALCDRLDQVEWMDEQTRRNAKALVRAEGRKYWGLPFPEAFGEGIEETCIFVYSYLLLQAHNLK